MSSITYFWWFVFCSAFVHLPVISFYFALDNWTEKIPINYPINRPIAKIVAVKSVDDDDSLTWTYRVKSTGSIYSGIGVDPNTGLVHLTESPQSHLIGKTIPVDFFAQSGSIVESTSASVTFVEADYFQCGRPGKNACFLPSECRLSMWENDPVQAIANPTYLAYGSVCEKNRLFYAVKDNDYVAVDPKSGDVRIRQSLDREKTREINFTIFCNVTTWEEKRWTFGQRCSLSVMDVNDNGPTISNGDYVYLDLKEKLRKGDKLPLPSQIIVFDNDTINSNYSVELIGDFLDFFDFEFEKVNIAVDQGGIFKTLELKLKKALEFSEDSYQLTLIFEDRDLSPKYGERQKLVNLVIRNSIVRPINGSLVFTRHNVSIFNNETLYKRILGPFHKHVGNGSSDLSFSIKNVSSDEADGIFDVTTSQGIIYLSDPKRLKLLANRSFSFNLCWRYKTMAEICNFTGINVNVVYAEKTENNSPEWVTTCAINTNEDSCVRSVGPGANSSGCHWWRKIDRSSCVSNEHTCLDEQCDELESLDWNICPQDCALNVVPRSSGRTMGISVSSALGVCSCDPHVKKCSCSLNSRNDHSPSDTARSRKKITHLAKMSTDPSVERSTDLDSPEFRYVTAVGSVVNSEHCDSACLSLVLSGVILLGVVLLIFLSCLWMRKRRKMRAGRPKYLGSAMSLSAVPSDYVDERSSSVVSQAVSMSDTLLAGTIKLHVPIDLRWEFPRNQLIIEQTLGEGEFGKVMRAKAFGIAGKPGFSTVAVKMLKSNGTNAEFQDLLSEYNLLKEVSHQNVIKLLGACTVKGGPLYIIVEYAEYGSMRGFLRKSRQLELDTYTSEDSGVGSLFLANNCWSGRLYQVSPRDLLSFMWQISKGMSYLSEMKVVHRDLATRNMLIAKGKVVKISDFGLSRDVYEGDTYFKKSKGRVPVKWMAIESLFNHVYTSKSDVWSFGVAMWEIVTLGSIPYPGVPPERLFHLLKVGYRMEKPDNCSDELYNLMLQCWKENAHERPTFRELTNKFDKLLQEKVEYLDLGFNMVHNMAYFEDYQTNGHVGAFDDDEDDDATSVDARYGCLNMMSAPSVGERDNRVLGEPAENCLLLPLASSSNYPPPNNFRNETADVEVAEV